MKRKIYLNKMSLANAQEKFFQVCGHLLLSEEEVRVSPQVCGRVTAEPVFSMRSAPHYPASAMDGIAVKAIDTAGASARNPIQLKVGLQALWVDTGAPLPQGCNAVIKVEEINQLDEEILMIEEAAAPWQHVRSIGESVVKGQLVLPIHHQITSYDLGGLLEAGITRLKVRRQPSVSIIPTGTELVQPDQEPGIGELIEFNSSFLAANIVQWGGLAQVGEILPDDAQAIRNKLISDLEEHDLVVLIAGSSAGERDYTVQILSELGEVLVHGVNIMPGKPVILAQVNGKPVIGLPGYPLAAALIQYLFLRPLLYQMVGLPVPATPVVEAKVQRKVPSVVGLAEFLRVNLAEIDGELVAVPRKKGAAAMDSLLRADGILPIAETKEGVQAGSQVNCYLLKSEREIRQNLLMVGSHDLTLDLIANQLRADRAGFDLNIQSVGSLAGLMALKRRETHLAGAHLLDAETGQYNQAFVQRTLPGQKMALIRLVERQQGLMVLKGNPKGIREIGDLTRPEIVFINRQRGAGTRVLLDYWLHKLGILPEMIQGYQREEYTHISAAVAVAGGTADTALGIMAAAQALDLDFVPLAEEQYDLVLPYARLNDWRVQYLIEMISSSQFKAQVQALGGYRTEKSGQVQIIE